MQDQDINLEQFELKDTLNPSIWRQDGDSYVLKSGAHEKLLSIAMKFWDSLGFDDEDISDILLVGSSCNYNWSDVSDIDLHLVVNFADIDDNTRMIEDYFRTKSKQWNNAHENLHIGNSPVEVFVQDTTSTCGDNSKYSLIDNKWLVEPKKGDLGELSNNDTIRRKSAMLMSIIDGMEKASQSCEDEGELYDDIQDFLSKLSGFRKKGLSRGGEMDYDNIVYKVLRRAGYLQQIYDLSDRLFDRIYSQP